MSTAYPKTRMRIFIMVIEGLVSASALVAGLLFVVRPDGSLLGMTTALLSATPFTDYTVPGVLLALVIGCGTLLAASSVGWRTRHAPQLVMASGAMLLFFEIVENALIGFNPQQAVIVLVGIVLIVLAPRLAGPVLAAEVALQRGMLVVRFPGASTFLVFKKQMEIPLGNVIGADRAAERAGRRWQAVFGLRGRGADSAIAISLRGERRSRLVIEVADPNRAIAAIRAAIAGTAPHAA